MLTTQNLKKMMPNFYYIFVTDIKSEFVLFELN